MSDVSWYTWLQIIPHEQQEALYRILHPKFTNGHTKVPSAQEAANTSIKVTRSPTDDLLVANPPAYVDVFDLHSIYRRIAFDSNLLLKGPKGDGKSLSVISFAAQECIPLVIQECSEDTKKNDLQGSQFLIGTETVFSLGCIPTAIDVANEMGKCILLFEEMNALTPQVQKQLNAVTDFRKMSSLPHIGKTYRLHGAAQLWVVGTMNPTVYGGTYDLNEDLKSRFEELEVTYPSHEQEIRILKGSCQGIIGSVVTEAQLDLLIRLAKETRQEKTGYALSTRDLDRLIRNVAKVGLNTALQMVLCKFEGVDRDVVMKRVASIFGQHGWKKYWGGVA